MDELVMPLLYSPFVGGGVLIGIDVDLLKCIKLEKPFLFHSIEIKIQMLDHLISHIL